MRTAFPYLKSVFRAYKETTGTNKSDDSIFNKYFSRVMTQNNLGAPAINQSTSMQILAIQTDLEELEARTVLQRYYVLFKKNDPKVGGTTYLQSKVYAAKECLMARYPDAQEQEMAFYKQVIEPEEKAEEEERAEAERQKKAETDKNNMK